MVRMINSFTTHFSRVYIRSLPILDICNVFDTNSLSSHAKLALILEDCRQLSLGCSHWVCVNNIYLMKKFLL